MYFKYLLYLCSRKGFMKELPTYTPDFEEYIRQGEPDKKERAQIWRTAIGLQQVDGLETSEYMRETVKRNIEGEISIDEVQRLVHAYYVSKSVREPGDEEREEADKVAGNISNILASQTLDFSTNGYISLHRRIFAGVFKHAGQIRTYDITKKEFVLRGGTVNYLNHEDLRAALEYDIAQEKPFSYKGLTPDEIVAHIAHFVGDLWQIHAFGEGNTRTTAVFTILYLRSIGFDVNNDLFAAHSKYFRDALVRANYKNVPQGVDYSPIYLERFFRNLLLGENWVLKSRYLVINPPAEFAEQPREDAGKLQKPAQMRENNAGKLQKPAFKTETIRRVYELICSNPRIKQAQMATILNLDDSTIERATAWLRKNGYINKEHSKIKGEWQLEP